MEKFFNDIKNEFLRIIGKNDSVEKAETSAELLTALQKLPSVSEYVASETEKIKGDLEKDFNVKVESVKETTLQSVSTLTKEVNTLKDSISKLNLEINKPVPTPQSANVDLSKESNTDLSKQIQDLSKQLSDLALGKL